MESGLLEPSDVVTQEEKVKIVEENQRETELIFELSKPGKKSFVFPKNDVPEKALSALIPQKHLRQKKAELPEVAEIEIVRHFTNLSRKNFSIDTHFYPLGSCTMKYNPKIHEDVARMHGFSHLHPYAPDDWAQGILQVLWELEQSLCEISGMDRICLQPAAGAHGELLGLLLARAYHTEQGNPRKKVILPDSAHGTNPSSAHIAGYEVVSLKTNSKGEVDLEQLKQLVDEETAALMITNPNTLGLFERQIMQIQKVMHDVGALLYYDGANLNPLLGVARPGDMGFDIVHINVHKTFTTPHGGGGPGAGPVGVKKRLIPYLPVPTVEKDGERFYLKSDHPKSIGKIRSFVGSTGILLRAYTYIRSLGQEGLEKVGKGAILNANYLLSKLKKNYNLPYDRTCMHEFVLSTKGVGNDLHAMDVAKRLIDLGFHPPTVYFPLIVPEAVMIEPTETESKRTLDQFADAMIQIVRESNENPEKLKAAPQNMPITRPDEATAARKPILRWHPGKA